MFILFAPNIYYIYIARFLHGESNEHDLKKSLTKCSIGGIENKFARYFQVPFSVEFSHCVNCISLKFRVIVYEVHWGRLYRLVLIWAHFWDMHLAHTVITM